MMLDLSQQLRLIHSYREEKHKWYHLMWFCEVEVGVMIKWYLWPEVILDIMPQESSQQSIIQLQFV